MKEEAASTKSVQEFRGAVAAGVRGGGAVLVDLIDVLATRSRPGSVFSCAGRPRRSSIQFFLFGVRETALAPRHYSLYRGLSAAAGERPVQPAG